MQFCSIITLSFASHPWRSSIFCQLLCSPRYCRINATELGLRFPDVKPKYLAQYCMNIAYMASLLTHGYGFPEATLQIGFFATWFYLERLSGVFGVQTSRRRESIATFELICLPGKQRH